MNQNTKDNYLSDIETLTENLTEDLNKRDAIETIAEARKILNKQLDKLQNEVTKESLIVIEYLSDSLGGKNCTMQSLTN